MVRHGQWAIYFILLLSACQSSSSEIHYETGPTIFLENTKPGVPIVPTFTPRLEQEISRETETMVSPTGFWELVVDKYWIYTTGWTQITYGYSFYAKSAHDETTYLLLQDEGVTSGEGFFPVVIFWTIDNNSLFFTDTGHISSFNFNFYGPLYVADLTTGEVRKYPDTVLGPYAVSPDQKYLAHFAYDGDNQYVVLTNLEVEKEIGRTAIEGEVGRLVWAEDSSLFTFVSVPGSFADRIVYIFEPSHLELIGRCVYSDDRVVSSEWRDPEVVFQHATLKGDLQMMRLETCE
jgi:hypothetical protein